MNIETYTGPQLAAATELEQLLYWHFTLAQFSSMKDFLDGITGRTGMGPLYSGWNLSLVARERGQVVGWAAIYAPAHLPDDREIGVFVDPDRRLEGVGTALVRRAVQSAGECRLRMEDNMFYRRLFPDGQDDPKHYLRRYVQLSSQLVVGTEVRDVQVAA